MFFSIIIPVFNRPQEIHELLESLCLQDFNQNFEVIVIEDGSTDSCQEEITLLEKKLNIKYFYKKNSGPGDSRNFGMNVAKGEYFVIFDSDCIIPPSYLSEVSKALTNNYVDCFGGSDAALESFSDIQKAINFVMTSFWTTGGIRGGSEKLTKFQPRSFNMGISKIAFETSKGFGTIHPGEDPDLSMRLWNMGFETQLFPKAFVYHKRRINWEKFYFQVRKFGLVRPILNSWHPKHTKLTFFVPTIFILGIFIALLLFVAKIPIFIALYGIYFAVLFLLSSYQNKSLKIGLYSIFAAGIQFYGYGIAFLESFIKIQILKKNPETTYPSLFFKKTP